MQNYLTNITVKMTKVQSSWGPMGRVHKGFWNAMGDPIGHSKPTPVHNDNRALRIELINTSVYRTIVSAIQGAAKIIKFVSLNLFRHVKEPVDSTWIGPDADIISHSMYAQAERYILQLMTKATSTSIENRRRMGLSHGSEEAKKKKRLFITGHSLGGAMGTSKIYIYIYIDKGVFFLIYINTILVFLGKMLQSKSPLLDHFAGLYTYGQPKIGDAEFSKVFSPRMTSKIFHHAYNNDIIPRMPTLWNYEYVYTIHMTV
jgi:predicted lipase